MTRKRFSEEAALDLLRQIDLDLASGSTVETAIRTAGISEATYYKWRKLYGGMGKSQLRELKAMEKENARLKRIVAAFVAISLYNFQPSSSKTAPARAIDRMPNFKTEWNKRSSCAQRIN